MQSQCDRHIQVEALRREIARLEGGLPSAKASSIGSGCKAIDGLLPENGFRRGTLVEWLAAGEGVGAAALALATAAEACRDGGGLVLLDRSREFYPPAAAAFAIDPTRLIVVHAMDRADHYWAMDQALRCPAVAAVVAWPDAMEDRFDGQTFRRLQLAAEEGGGLGLLIRPEAMRHQPSWADVRLLVEPLPITSSYGMKHRQRVRMLRGRGGAGSRAVEVEIDDESRDMHLLQKPSYRDPN